MAFRPWQTLSNRILSNQVLSKQVSSKLLVVSLVVTVLAFSAVCGSVLLDMRQSAEQLARQTMENLAATVDADVSRNIELYDQSLQAVVKNLSVPELADVSKPLLQLILFDRAATAAHLGPIQVFDAEGRLRLDATTLKPVEDRRDQDDFFKIHRDDPRAGLYISRPMPYHGEPSIVLSRRLQDPKGGFAGVVAGSIRISYFRDLFDRLRLGDNDVIALLKRDGVLVMRRPFEAELIGRDLSAVPSMTQVLTSNSGWFSGKGLNDRIPRMYVWADSNRPLVVLVGRPWQSILGLWRREAIRLGSILLALAVFVAGVTIFLIREIDRRARAEQRLEELSVTDPLTGLTNRRKFDAAIDEEWRRAQRRGSPMALLMIDADLFKQFNDSHGHQAGDQMLIGIAVCISDSVHRAGDCAARFGGEEFAVLLPGLAAPDALSVAESIRTKVERWSLDQTGVTISVGVASLIPAPSVHWSELVEAADKALYAAKESGRNACVVAPTREPLTLVA
uniref:diguanylate cyclase n=1 Tax=Rhodopseudomonas palustris (strain BisA53) TaxID=316055 RepID=Q07TT8_RHOP5